MESRNMPLVRPEVIFTQAFFTETRSRTLSHYSLNKILLQIKTCLCLLFLYIALLSMFLQATAAVVQGLTTGQI